MCCHHLDYFLDGYYPLLKNEEEIQKVRTPNTISKLLLSPRLTKQAVVLESSHHSVLRDVLWFDT